MSEKIKLPAYLQKLIDSQGTGTDGDQLVSATTSVPRISCKGRQFRFIEEGEEVKKTSEPIQVVILGAQPEHGMAKTYYKGKYNPNDSGPPACSSENGIRPDSWVSEPQSNSCSTCEQNKWGSATSMAGKKAKACRDSKRLWVVEPDKIKEGKMYILNATISSLRALSEYGKLLISNQLPMAAVITTVSMADSDFPQMEFELAGVLNEKEGTLALARSAEKSWVSIDTRPALTDNAPPRKALEANTSSQAAPSKVTTVDNVLDQWGTSE